MANIADKVVEYFEANPYSTLTTGEIATRWGVSRDYVRRFMGYAVKRGSVKVLRRERHNAPVYGKGSGVPVKRPGRSRRPTNDGGLSLAAVWR